MNSIFVFIFLNCFLLLVYSAVTDKEIYDFLVNFSNWANEHGGRNVKIEQAFTFVFDNDNHAEILGQWTRLQGICQPGDIESPTFDLNRTPEELQAFREYIPVVNAAKEQVCHFFLPKERPIDHHLIDDFVYAAARVQKIKLNGQFADIVKYAEVGNFHGNWPNAALSDWHTLVTVCNRLMGEQRARRYNANLKANICRAMKVPELVGAEGVSGS